MPRVIKKSTVRCFIITDHLQWKREYGSNQRLMRLVSSIEFTVYSYMSQWALYFIHLHKYRRTKKKRDEYCHRFINMEDNSRGFYMHTAYKIKRIRR